MTESILETNKPLQVVVFAGDPLAVPTINLLLQQQVLAGVVFAQLQDAFSSQLSAWLQQSGCPCICFNPAAPEQLEKQLEVWQADAAAAFNFPYELSAVCEHSPAFGLYYFHATPQNQYKGPRPLYWQIRDSQLQTQLILQKAGVEEGMPDIAVSHNQIIHPLDTLQCLEGKVAQQAALMFAQLLTQLSESNGQIKLQLLPFQAAAVKAAPHPRESDLHVDWLTMGSEQIAALTRAGNQQFGGSVITLGQTQLSLLQATVIEHPTYGVAPGTICFIGEPQGVIAATCDGAVRLDILANADGIFNGISFTERFAINAGMGFVSGPAI
ncbi:hypothetical protein [Psychromonas aquimarina]|uniref:hypothetical protein n=1 Tax=Psychromonas aquimarina TaxID=444919 RepID=UPI000429F5B1|nr:hypothetical protein [Psychromonas aquimarina]